MIKSSPTRRALLTEIEELHARLDEAEQTLDAIRAGDVDALVVAGPSGDLVFSLTGAERIYRLIVETMNEAALTVDLEGNILFCNKRFSALVKRPMSETIGQKVTAFVAPAQKPPLQKFLAKAKAGPVHRSLILRAADGVGVSVQLAASPLEEGTNTSICLVMSDLTELEAQADSIRVMHQYQQALEESKAELQAANFLLSQSRLAALNVAEDAIAARRQAEEAVADLQREVKERKQAEDSLRASDQRYRALFNNGLTGLAHCRILLDEKGRPMDYRFLDINDTFVKLTGLTESTVLGRTAKEIMPCTEKSDFDFIGVLGKVALSGEETVFDQYNEQLHRWYSIFVYSPEKEYFVSIFSDITERKKAEEQIKISLAEKEVMLREIHHRVKNNLQVISSLISLQADSLTDEHMREEFNDVRDRVRSMALIHEKLYQAGDLAQLNFSDYAAGLLHSLWRSHGALAEKARLNLALSPVALPIEMAVPCGLVLNELAGNALKHAFPGSSGGEVTVALEHDAATGTVCLRVSDNGVGLPADLDWRQSCSLGLRLVQILAGQLRGLVETGTGPGADFIVTFSLELTHE